MKNKLAVVFMLTLIASAIIPIAPVQAVPGGTAHIISSGTNGVYFNLSNLNDTDWVEIHTSQVVELTGGSDKDISIQCKVTDAKLTIKNVSIESSTAVIDYIGTGNKLNLEGTNELDAGQYSNCVQVADNGSLTIEGTGTIIARGGAGNISPGNYIAGGSGIGGSSVECTITIDNGNIYAYGGLYCAGIGGGNMGNSHIIINNGTIHEAIGGSSGAGIGGGTYGDGSIDMFNGTISYAYGSFNSAGIGGGTLGYGTVNIHGGTITKADTYGGGSGIGGGSLGYGIVNIYGGNVTAYGDNGGAAIGGGKNSLGIVAIEGGTVKAVGGKNAAGIGGGESGYCDVKIKGGNIDASVYYNGAAAIGSGVNATYPGTIEITGGFIIAKGGYSSLGDSAAIGGGTGALFGNITIKGGEIYAMAGGTAADDIGKGEGGTRGLFIIQGGTTFLWNNTAVPDLTANVDYLDSETVVQEGIGTFTAYTFNSFPYYFNNRTAYGYVHFAITEGTEGTYYDISLLPEDITLYIETADKVELTGSRDNISVVASIQLDVVIRDVEINTDMFALSTFSTNDILTLEGESTLGSYEHYPGIFVLPTTKLTIQGDGILNAYSGYAGIPVQTGAAIGGLGDSGEIVINGGTINAAAYSGGAAIGGGYRGSAVVSINDGNVYATAGLEGAGIGGGDEGTGYVTITGGRVETFINAYSGAGIGGGNDSPIAGFVNISGGLVIARGGSDAGTNRFSAGIGGGYDSVFGHVAITGGQVYAIGGSGAHCDDIGAGNGGICTDIGISGDSAVFLLNDKLGVYGGSTVTTTGHTYVNSETVVENSAYGFDNFPDEFNTFTGYGYLKKVNVAFNHNHSVAPQIDLYEHWAGELVTKPANPQRSGYHYNGWHLANDGTTPFYFDSMPAYEGLVLYADWVAEGTLNGIIDGTFSDIGGAPAHGYHLTLESEPITVTTSASGYSFGNVFYIGHTLIIRDSNGALLRRYTIVINEGTSTNWNVAGDTITLTVTERTTGVHIPIGLDGTGRAHVSGEITFTETQENDRAVNPQTSDTANNLYHVFAIAVLALLMGVYAFFKRRYRV